VWNSAFATLTPTTWNTSNSTPNGGSESITIKSATVSLDTGTTKLYAVHGSFAAKVPVTTGGPATAVDVPITF